MDKVLVSCATQAFGMRVVKLLSDKFQVIKATSDEVPTIMRAQYAVIPKGLNPVFAHELLKTCIDLQCSYVLLLNIDEIKVVAESIMLFEEYGIKVLSPNMTALADLEMIANPPKDLFLDLMYDNKSLLTDAPVPASINGLGILSDDGGAFILAVSK